MKKSKEKLFHNGLWSIIKSDLERLCNPTFKNFLFVYLFPRGTVFPYIVWFRIQQWCRISKIRKFTLGVLSYPIMRHYEYKYGIHANPNIFVGKGLHIVHGDGVYLNCKRIGEHFTVYQGVTLGTDGIGETPSVMDFVTVYTNAVVVGNIILNNGAVVGAQSYVNKDIGVGEVFAGVPARDMMRKYGRQL